VPEDIGENPARPVRRSPPGAPPGLGEHSVQGMTAWHHMEDHSPVWTITRERTGNGARRRKSLTGFATLTMHWSGTFVPEGPDLFHLMMLNAGTLTLTGTSTVTRGSTSGAYSGVVRATIPPVIARLADGRGGVLRFVKRGRRRTSP